MRTNIDIDDALMEAALKAGPYQTKKDAVEAGLRLLARQAAYREILKWRGKLQWEGDDASDWTRASDEAQPVAQAAAAPVNKKPQLVAEKPAPYAGRASTQRHESKRTASSKKAGLRRAGG